MFRWLALLALIVACDASAAEQIVTLATRSGVTQSYLLSVPVAGKPLAVTVLFAGGGGSVNLAREKEREHLERGNFLVRSRRLFAQAGMVAAVMDAPSDHPTGMEDEFRLGAAHAADIGKVVADLGSRFPGLAVFLVGTSRGTVSAANAGARMRESVKGVVLTATVFEAGKRPGRPGLSDFDLGSISVPLLLVHHVDDECGVTPYAAARALAERYPLISVSGGPPPQSGPCQAMSSHGFLGREAETVREIVNWMLGRPFRKTIE
ncbi:MAG: alpha/beta hydrolase [Burkholderiales bacterium]